jgi:hypothetical protein
MSSRIIVAKECTRDERCGRMLFMTIVALIYISGLTSCQQQSGKRPSAVIQSTPNNQPSAFIQIASDNPPISNSDPVILRRGNSGQLLTFFKTLSQEIVTSGDESSGTFVSFSDDNGVTWSEKHLVSNVFGGMDVIENMRGQLVILLSGPSGNITAISDDGHQWNNIRKVTTTRKDDRASSIIQAKDGYYYVSYDSIENITVNNTTMAELSEPCIARSNDLINWEKVLAISSPPASSYKSGREVIMSSEFGTTLIQLGNGDFYSAYISYPERGIVVMKSSNGIDWAQVGLIKVTVFSDVRLDMIEYGGKLVVLYDTYIQGETVTDLYASTLSGGKWMGPTKIIQNIPFGADAISLGLGSDIGIVFSKDYLGKRDILFQILDSLPLER